MIRKLSAMMALLAILVLIATWLIRRALELPTLDLNEFFGVALAVVALYFFVFGRVLAGLGVALVREVIDERRSRAEMQRNRARQRYEQTSEAAGEAGEQPGTEA